MKKLLFICCLSIVFTTIYAQVSPMVQLSDTARIFGKDVISTGDFEFNASFTPDSKTVFFSKASLNFGYIAIFYSTQKGAQWTNPVAVSFTGIYRDTDPFVSADGKRLYFSSDRPVNGQPYKDNDYHYFYVQLDGNKVVSEPALLDLSLPAGIKPSYLSFADNGNAYYYSSDSNIGSNHDADIYMSEFKNGIYLPPVNLPFNDKRFIDIDPVVAHDESFIIFASNTRKGLGGRDLWVSFKKAGTWTDPINMGDKVNTKGSDGAPGLSRDDNTLYFISNREATPRPVYKNGKITTQAILELLHSTKNGVPHIYEINISDINKLSVK